MEVCRQVEPVLTEIEPGPRIIAGQPITVNAGQSTACHLFAPSSRQSVDGT
jgi:hypothetical protein